MMTVVYEWLLLIVFIIYMKIKVNNKETETSAKNIGELAKEMNLPERGVALAVGQTMIKRVEWDSTPLEEGDSVLIIKAACGG